MIKYNIHIFVSTIYVVHFHNPLLIINTCNCVFILCQWYRLSSLMKFTMWWWCVLTFYQIFWVCYMTIKVLLPLTFWQVVYLSFKVLERSSWIFSIFKKKNVIRTFTTTLFVHNENFRVTCLAQCFYWYKVDRKCFS